jgi:PAS domain S-box-containing protein
LENKKILVVEDEIIVSKNLKNRLENLGYSVPAIVTSGEDAIIKSDEIKPDLVLMDIMLEGDVDGIEAADHISKNYNIPVIYLTAYGDNETLERAKITDPYGYILKPFEVRELHNNIEIALFRHTIKTKLKNNEQWLTAVLSSIGDAVIATDKDELVTFMNPVAESLTGWNQKETLGKPLNAIFNLIDEKSRKSEKSLAKASMEKDTVMNLDDRNVLLVTKDGKDIPIDDSAAPIKNHEGNTTGSIIVFRDITKRKQTELELEEHRNNLEKLVEERTSELSTTNTKLLKEISKRRKAEEDAINSKDNLHNIINSASEIIISVDRNKKVTLWNKKAELLTGYKEKEVTGKSILDLSVFEKSDEFLDNLECLYNNNKPSYNDLILIAKNGDKRIVNVSCSFVKSDNGQDHGILFVGSDITNELEIHGKLIKGISYLITDNNNKSALDLFTTLKKHDYESLYITRSNPEIINNISSIKDSKVVLLSEKKIGEYNNISDPEELITEINKFVNTKTNPVILIDGIHYLLTRFSFEKFTETIYQIRDIISDTKSILLLHLDPMILDEKQIAVMENELQLLPGQKIDNVVLRDELFEILLYINNQNQNNSEVSFKKISKNFSIVTKTTSKRLKKLEDKGLIFIKKRGRMKSLHLTQKGKTLLNKRLTV